MPFYKLFLDHHVVVFVCVIDIRACLPMMLRAMSWPNRRWRNWANCTKLRKRSTRNTSSRRKATATPDLAHGSLVMLLAISSFSSTFLSSSCQLNAVSCVEKTVCERSLSSSAFVFIYMIDMCTTWFEKWMLGSCSGICCRGVVQTHFAMVL